VTSSVSATTRSTIRSSACRKRANVHWPAVGVAAVGPPFGGEPDAVRCQLLGRHYRLGRRPETSCCPGRVRKDKDLFDARRLGGYLLDWQCLLADKPGSRESCYQMPDR
jgi:hypothetical protein